MKGNTMAQSPNTIASTLATLRFLLDAPDYATHWQTACRAYWGAVLDGLPEEKRNRPCPMNVHDLVESLEHIDIMELHAENEAIYDWLVKTFPDIDGDTYHNNTAEVPHEPYPQDPHDA
jgi:hypothetical protein